MKKFIKFIIVILIIFIFLALLNKINNIKVTSNGLSAYELAVQNGYNGSLEFLVII